MNTRIPVPGMRSPGVGFEQPFEMLDACHERVLRSLKLLDDLRAYLRTHPSDDMARQAARDVLRYFDIAAPLHHQDEELHIFPSLRQRRADDALLMEIIQRLERDHREMTRAWLRVREPLLGLADHSIGDFSEADEAAFEQFIAHYRRHLADEDRCVYPPARAVVDATEQARMGREMAARRG